MTQEERWQCFAGITETRNKEYKDYGRERTIFVDGERTVDIADSFVCEAG